MDCIYIDTPLSMKSQIEIADNDLSHFKALRIRTGEKLLVTNGLGETVLVETKVFQQAKAILQVLDFYYNFNENSCNVDLALGILDNRERFEFAIEKAVELGVKSIFPIKTDFTQKNNIKKDRLIQKAVAALIQSKRSLLPLITEPLSLNDLIDNFKNYDRIYLFDEKGQTGLLNEVQNTLVLIGPEGGFSNKEKTLITKSDKVNIISLGTRRLRAETAVISSLTLINNLNT